jgi:hypothetical protein
MNVTPLTPAEVMPALQISVKFTRGFRLRVLMGVRLMRLGAWIMGSACDVEIEVE